MLKCCICGRRLGVLGEDRYKITEEYIACYQCTSFFRGMKEAKNVDQLVKNENGLKMRVEENNLPQEILDAIEIEIQRIKDSKQELYSKVKFQALSDEALREKRKEFLVNTGYNFEGYVITRYLDLVHGEIVLGTGFYSELSASISDIFGISAKAFEGKISQAKRLAQEQMIINAITINANAIIGIDFDITTFSNNMIGVSVNGTAVVIEKIKKEKSI